jgi:hypothetical protein
VTSFSLACSPLSIEESALLEMSVIEPTLSDLGIDVDGDNNRGINVVIIIDGPSLG